MNNCYGRKRLAFSVFEEYDGVIIGHFAYHILDVEGLFVSRVINIDYGIIKVEMLEIFGIGGFSCYHGTSGLSG